MKNADKFKKIFGTYATEIWVKPEKEFVDWLNEDFPEANILPDLPTADVRENVYGRWIVDEDGNIECSVCGHHGVGDLYCERCGAQMSERREDAEVH